MEATTEVVKLDPFIESELAKFEIRKEDLEALVKSTDGLSITGVEDKEGYKRVHDARMLLKKKRVEISTAAKAMRARATAFNKAILAREDDFVGILSPRETELQAQEDAIDEAREKIRIEAEQAEDHRIQKLINQLAAVGYAADVVTIKGFTDEQFEQTLSEATAAYQTKLEEEERERKDLAEKNRLEDLRRQEQEENNRLENLRLAAIHDEQEKKDKELRAEREKFEAEKLQMQKDKLAAREQRMFTLGFKWDGTKYDFMGFRIPLAMVNEDTDANFNQNCKNWEVLIADLKKKALDDAAQEEERLRLKGIQDEKDRQENLRLAKEATDLKLKEEEAERLAAAPDAEKFKLLLTSIASIDFPEMKSRKYKTAIKGFKGELDQILHNYGSV